MTRPASERLTFDQERLSGLHKLFQACWLEVEAKLSLDSETASSLRRTMASRILMEADRGEIDEQVLRRKALIGILPLSKIGGATGEFNGSLGDDI